MSTYTITFADALEIKVTADDSDMAAIAARQSAGNEGRVISMVLDGMELVAPEPKAPLPPRRNGALTLTYDNGSLRVVRFQYSASLALAADLGVLCGYEGDEVELSDADMEVVWDWAGREAEYLAYAAK